jgi:hypothetical protein
MALTEKDYLKAIKSYRKQIEIAHDIMDTEQQVQFFAVLNDWNTFQRATEEE